jgi:hypothetical protein
MAHTTDVQKGDRFVFRGLTGETHDDEPEITIRNVTVDGKVVFDVTGPGAAPFFAAAYSECLLMIEQGIWEGPMRSGK